MKECPICGLVLPNWARKCPECKYEYEDMSKSSEIPKDVLEFRPRMHFKSERDKKFTIISLCVSAVIIAVSVCYVAFFYTNTKDDSDSKTKGSSTQCSVSETFTQSNNT